MSLRASGAPRSESKITMTASGSHTLMWLTLAWPPSGDSLRSQSVTPAFPAGEGGLRVPRKRETDEGHLPLPLGEVPGRGGEGFFCPLSHFVTAPPEWEPRKTDCRTSDIGHWLAMTGVAVSQNTTDHSQ